MMGTLVMAVLVVVGFLVIALAHKLED